jgi:c-di-GMP-related signal transduction protein
MVDIEEKKKTFMARQPIFDRRKNIYGYELLFRHGLENFFDETLDKDYASSKVLLDSFLVFDLNDLTRGKRAFLNFTERVLLSEVANSFPKNTIIIELLENIEPTPEIVAACAKLKSKGYLLALDDFQYHPRFKPLIQLADIIKVDFLITRGEKERQDIIKKSGDRVIYLAEKVETLEEYNQAREMGYTYFQGYYFSRPVIVAGKEIPSHKLNLVQILKEIHQPEMDFIQLGNIIQRDVSLSYKLLRFINSAAFGIPNEIHSIRHALNLLGINEFKKWIPLVLLSQMGSDKPNELMINSLIRANGIQWPGLPVS